MKPQLEARLRALGGEGIAAPNVLGAVISARRTAAAAPGAGLRAAPEDGAAAEAA